MFKNSWSFEFLESAIICSFLFYIMLCYAAIPIICQGIPGIAVVHIAEKYYFTPTTQPPPAHNPNYRGSRRLTLTLGQPMYPNIGANIKCGITV
jgi:hypothetical protein